MTKPDDIPSDIWQTAIVTWSTASGQPADLGDPNCAFACTIIAMALRGVREETQRNVDRAIRYARGEVGDTLASLSGADKNIAELGARRALALLKISPSNPQ